MKVVVTGPTGHIGNVVARRLLDAGASVAVFARDPSKVRDLAGRGARVFQGSLESEADVMEATRGFDALYWMTPPNVATPDVIAYQDRLGKNAAAAIRANGIRRVVNLSSIGAQLSAGTGPIKGLHRVEKTINAAATNVTHVRPVYFMENTLGSLETIRAAKSVFLPIPGSVRVPMIATHDVGEWVAKRLLDESWSGKVAFELYGPDELSFDAMAATLTKVLGEPVRHVQVTREQASQALLGMGLGKSMTDLYLEMFTAFEKRKVVGETPRGPANTTSTSFEEFVRTTLAPLLKGAQVSG